jgi:WD40 repeat protein
MIVLATAFVVSCALAIYAWQKRQFVEAERKRVQKELYLSDMRTAYESFALNSIPRTLELLDAHADDELRGFEWYHLWWLLQGDLETLKGHTQLVRSVAFSPDGKTMASSSGDNTIKLWDVVSHSEIATLRGHTKLVRSVAFSPDGKTLASASSDSTIKLWDVASHKELETLKGHKGEIYSVAFSPDGTTVASGGGLDKIIKLWDVASRSEVGELGKPNKLGKRESHNNAVYCVAFSPDGKTLASGSIDNTIKLWDVASRDEITMLPRQTEGVNPVLPGHTKGVNSVAFSFGGKMLASGSDDGTIKLWDLASYKELAELRDRNNRIRSVAFSPDGKMLASGSDDSTVKLWDVTENNELAKLWDRVPPVEPSPDEKVLASPSPGNLDKTKKLWDVTSRRRLTTFKGHRDMVNCVAFSLEGNTVASGSDDSTIKLWDATSPNKLHAPFKRHTETANVFPSVAVAVSPDGETLASSDSADVEIKLSDVASPNSKPVVTLKGEGIGNYVYCVAFSPDGKTLASAHATNTIMLWDVASAKSDTVAKSDTLKYEVSKGDRSWFLSVAFSPDGKTLASGSSDGIVRLWNIASPNSEPITLNENDKGKDKGVRTLAFSPDGKALASGSDDSTIRLWGVASHKELATLKGHSSRVTSVMFSPDRKTLASGSFDNTIKLWDVASLEELATLKGHTDSVLSIAFSPKNLLASGCKDGSIKMWDVASRKELGTLKEPGTLKEQKINRVTFVAFSPDGMTLASGHNNGYVMLRYSSTGEEVAYQRK